MNSRERRRSADEMNRNGAPLWFTSFLNNHFEHLVRRIEVMEQRLWMLLVVVVGGLVSLVIAVAFRGGL